MIRRVPILATLVVLAALGLMIRLGFWQLAKIEPKEALIARYAAAQAMSAEVPFPQDDGSAEKVLYRHSRIVCREASGATAKAGQNAKGEAGQAHIAQCTLADGGRAKVVLGWSRDPAPVEWHGGEVSGIIAPGPRLVADPPVAGLAANARPDPNDIPNNHFSYMVQWFLFAATALVIYALALRKRLREG